MVETRHLLDELRQWHERADRLAGLLDEQRAELAAREQRLHQQEVEIERLREGLRQERVAVYRARRRRMLRMQALAEVSAALVSELDRGRLVERVVEAAHRITGASFAALFLRRDAPDADPKAPIFVPAALVGAPREAFPDVREVDPCRLRFEGILRPLFEEGRRQFVADVTAEPEHHGFPPGHPTIGSYVAEPLFDRGRRVFGALLVGDPQPNRFGEDDAEIVALLASQAGVTLDNVALYEAEIRTRRSMESEHELLSEVTARLRSVMHSMRDGLIVFDRSNRAVIVNPVVREQFGIEEDPLGWTPDDFARKVGHCFADPEVPSEIARETSEAPAESRSEFELVRPRHRWVERLTAPIGGPDGALGLVVVYHDLTERREVERLKDEFLSIAAHELRTPLTTIKAHAQMLLRRFEQAADPRALDLARVSRQLVTVDQQTARLARLIDELLDVSRIQTGKLALELGEVHLGDLAATVVDNLRLVVDSHPLGFERPGESLSLRADPDRLEQVLVNLVTNAVRYSEAGQPIEVVVGRATDSGGRPMARLAVRDRGIGIPDEELPRIFDRFYRAAPTSARPRSGLGLGLYISAEIVARHGGRIRAERRPGGGSSFTVELPLDG